MVPRRRPNAEPAARPGQQGAPPGPAFWPSFMAPTAVLAVDVGLWVNPWYWPAEPDAGAGCRSRPPVPDAGAGRRCRTPVPDAGAGRRCRAPVGTGPDSEHGCENRDRETGGQRVSGGGRGGAGARRHVAQRVGVGAPPITVTSWPAHSGARRRCGARRPAAATEPEAQAHGRSPAAARQLFATTVENAALGASPILPRRRRAGLRSCEKTGGPAR